MAALLYPFMAWLLGMLTVAFWAALGVRRDEVLRNPTRPGRVGLVSAIAFAVLGLACLATLFILHPPCP